MTKLFAMLLVALAVCAGLAYAQRRVGNAFFTSGNRGVYGAISFVVIDGVMHIEGTIGNLTDGKHGLHIHSSGNLRDNCQRIGDHYNPFNKTHSCDAQTGHLGDLGNVDSLNGVAYVNKSVKGMTLANSNGKEGNGNPGVNGLSIAVDDKEDKCTAADDGGSGPVISCGRIHAYRS